MRTAALLRPEVLIPLAAACPNIAFATWAAQLNNFAVERAGFGGVEMGILQSLREVPGLLGFGAVFLLLVVREQRLLYLMLAITGLGVALTGFFPSVLGLYALTMLMSLGHHYHSVVHNSLALQWVERERTPQVLGRAMAVSSAVAIVTYGLVWAAFDVGGLDYATVYAVGGGVTMLLALALWALFPRFPVRAPQRTRLVVRRRYWLFYALQFLNGGRRQIFVVFAAFLMVDKFAFTVGEMSMLFLVTSALNVVIAPYVGRWVAAWGERRALTVEYVGLTIIFTAYAFVERADVAAALYLADHLFFALTLAMSTYFQKIADPADIAATSGVSETVNHVAAVVVPAAFGFLWLISPAAVFLAGAGLALAALVLGRLIPDHPAPGREVVGLRAAA